MRITVLGAGAMGSLFGGYLALDHEVTLICRESQAEAIRKRGLSVTGLGNFVVRPRAVSSTAGLEPPELLFLTVKSYDTEAALADVKSLLSPKTVLITLQNGLGNVDTLKDAFPEARLVAGITSHAAIHTAPGAVEHTGKSYTLVGGSDDAGTVARVLTEAGFETEVSDDIERDIWYKALVNSAINPVATLLKEKNRAIFLRHELAPLIEGIVTEGVEVAFARGISLDIDVAIEKVMTVARETANNVCSMRQDIEHGRRTEIMEMNGAIARYGDETGVPTPVNGLLTALVRGLEPKNA